MRLASTFTLFDCSDLVSVVAAPALSWDGQTRDGGEMASQVWAKTGRAGHGSRWHRRIEVSVSVQPITGGVFPKSKRCVVIHNRLRAVRRRLIEVYPYNLKDFAKLRESKPVCPFTPPQASLLG